MSTRNRLRTTGFDEAGNHGSTFNVYDRAACAAGRLLSGLPSSSPAAWAPAPGRPAASLPSSSPAWPAAPSFFTSHVLARHHHLHRLPEAGLGIQQELRRSDHFLAPFKAGEHLPQFVIAQDPQLDLPGLEAALAQGDEHVLLEAGVKHRVGGHHHRLVDSPGTRSSPGRTSRA